MNSISFLYKAGFCDDIINLIDSYQPRANSYVLCIKYKEIIEDTYYKQFGKYIYRFDKINLPKDYIIFFFNLTDWRTLVNNNQRPEEYIIRCRYIEKIREKECNKKCCILQ